YVLGESYLTGSASYLTIKYDADGKRLWTKYFASGPGQNSHPHALALGPLGTVYVTGAAANTTDADFNGRRPFYDTATGMYDTDGHQLWVQSFSGWPNGYDGAFSIAVDAVGAAYVGGLSRDPSSTTGFDIIVSKFNP